MHKRSSSRNGARKEYEKGLKIDPNKGKSANSNKPGCYVNHWLYLVSILLYGKGMKGMKEMGFMLITVLALAIVLCGTMLLLESFLRTLKILDMPRRVV